MAMKPRVRVQANDQAGASARPAEEVWKAVSGVGRPVITGIHQKKFYVREGL